MTDFKKQGKNNRAKGKRFELKVRADLERKGWIVFRNSNDVTKPIETDIGEYERFFKQTTGHWNPFTRTIMMNSSGFPDFIGIVIGPNGSNQIEFFECKVNGKLDKIEKEKIEWIKNNLKIQVNIASKNGKEIKYEQQ